MAESSTDSLRDEAHHRLRQAIILLQHKPGEKLAIARVCDELGIGRTPVRGALQQLEKEGLVNMVPQSGTYVTKIDLKVAELARFTRETIEKEVAAECAALAGRADIDRIDEAIGLQRAAIDNGRPEDFFISDNLMHQAVFDIVGKLTVWKWLEITNADLERYRLLRVIGTDLELEGVYEQHLRMREAFLRHDVTEARFLTARHLHLMFEEAPKVLDLNPDYFA